ncbi:MAG: hypothetical protein K9K40_04840 [Desulfotignum sp.]|nr:hypothetical protein [Desulfotignum sp.]
MAWDPEKYREKRERVLGIQKKGISFSIMAAIVSVTILLGLGAVTVPNAVSLWQTRHLDDAIYRLTAGYAWPDQTLAGIRGMSGIKKVTKDHHGGRLVITFDRRRTGPEKFDRFLKEQGLFFALLNRVNHRQHQQITAEEKEAKK